MKLKKFLPVFFVIPFFLSACYEERVAEAVSKLRIGMRKAELDVVVKDLKFIREQNVVLYPKSSEQEMRAVLNNDQHYESITPEDLVERLTFDGNITVYSYLIRKKNIYSNPPLVDHLSVFFNRAEDKVIGWGHLRTAGHVDTWRDQF